MKDGKKLISDKLFALFGSVSNHTNLDVDSEFVDMIRAYSQPKATDVRVAIRDEEGHSELWRDGRRYERRFHENF